MKSNGIKKIFILDEDKNFFSRSENYEIPIYQRPYAWEEKQLCQLVDDIISFDENEYCIGSLIVYSKANLHEVIDGQQRLTSLYLLLNCLKINTDSTVSFPNRERSNYIIENIQNFVDNTYDDEQEKHAQAEILKGLNILKRILPRQNNERETFIEKLKKVYLYQIEVPQYTDLNHYFEIMNTRGEQLEQQDVLKANLMDYLIDEEDKASFACIWDACSDMNGYVQMHFSPKNRELLFGTGWNSKPTLSWRTFKKIHSDYSEKKSFDIQHIINQEFDIMKENEIDDDDNNVKFESIIDFPHFLIHAVKVFVNLYCDNKNEKITDELLDDKKLLKTFNDVIAKGVVDSKKIGYNRDGKSNFSQKFLMLLLKLRFVFDQYIIKRVYVENDPVGKWSLQSLAVSNKKAYYKNTSLALWREWEKTYGPRNKACLMLQSALRVSYTSPKNMHWITSLLSWLSSRGFENKLDQYCSVVEKIAIQTVKEDFLNQGEMGFDLGVDTPHIVFNYLDFLLWRKDQGNKRHKYDDFTFEFRNSVEHFYPQHPSDRSLDEWSHKDGLDYFGNLCLLPSSINSKFSNLAPKSKVDTYSKEFEKGSIKLRKMGSLVKNHDNVEWKKSICRRHGEEMINLLKEACEGF